MIEKTQLAFMIPAQLKQCGGQVAQQYGEERDGTRNPCAGVDVSRGSME